MAGAVSRKIGKRVVRASRRVPGASRPLERSRRSRGVVVRAENDGDKDGVKFMESGIGKVISSLSEFVASSPINKGKVAMVKMTAGEYDVEATKANLQQKIDSAPVVMFSFPK